MKNSNYVPEFPDNSPEERLRSILPEGSYAPNSINSAVYIVEQVVTKLQDDKNDQQIEESQEISSILNACRVIHAAADGYNSRNNLVALKDARDRLNATRTSMPEITRILVDLIENLMSFFIELLPGHTQCNDFFEALDKGEETGLTEEISPETIKGVNEFTLTNGITISANPPSLSQIIENLIQFVCESLFKNNDDDYFELQKFINQTIGVITLSPYTTLKSDEINLQLNQDDDTIEHSSANSQLEEALEKVSPHIRAYYLMIALEYVFKQMQIQDEGTCKAMNSTLTNFFNACAKKISLKDSRAIPLPTSWNDDYSEFIENAQAATTTAREILTGKSYKSFVIAKQISMLLISISNNEKAVLQQHIFAWWALCTRIAIKNVLNAQFDIDLS